MGNFNFILFVSIAVPMAMMLFVCKGKTRNIIIFFLIGMSACLFSGEVVGAIINKSGISAECTVINITPTSEEMCKLIPIVFFAVALQPKKQELLECAFAVGVGFAVQENAYILAMALDDVSIFHAVVRGFGAGMVHVVSALGIGYGMSFVNKRRKLSIPLTTALFAAAVVWHSIYNQLILKFGVATAILPMIIFTQIIIKIKSKKQCDFCAESA